MTQDQVIILAFKVVLLAGEAATILWIGVYTYLARWWKNPLGVTVVRLAALVALVLIPSILSLFFRFSRTTSRLAAWIDVVIFAVITVELLHRTPMWIRLHLHADGTRSYPALRTFAAQVWARRFRPLWTGGGPGDTPAIRAEDPAGPGRPLP